MTISSAPSSSHSADFSQQFVPLSFTQVVLTDTFWTTRVAVNRTQTLVHGYQLLHETGRIAALHLTWRPGMEPTPHIYWDSDVAKWLEAASYSIALSPDAELTERIDGIIALLARAQGSDGYVNSYYSVVAPEQRWTNLRDGHELYCAGHLIEAAVAHVQATGKRTLLDIACRYADYIATVFGPEPEQKHGYDGHEEIELALIKLYRETGIARYLDLSRYFIEQRGQQPHFFDVEARVRSEDPAAFPHTTYEYNQSHRPVREQHQVVGHAVRAMYLYAAMTDLAYEIHDSSLLRTCQTLWQHLCTTRLYLTGGVGSSRHNEGFTSDFDLPNETAYAETCAAVGLLFWSHRLLQGECDGRYADVMERALYNGVLSGVSLDGTTFFYQNPLASSGDHHRQRWYATSCCPTNIMRLLPSLGQYIYSVRDQSNASTSRRSDQPDSDMPAIAVHLYLASRAQIPLGNQILTIQQKTEYPWDGHITLEVSAAEPTPCTLRLRIPGWCRSATLTVNDVAIPFLEDVDRGYIPITRTWHGTETVVLSLAMPVERLYAHPDVLADVGRVALSRGPLIYCVEEIDQRVSVSHLRLSPQAAFQVVAAPELLGGIMTLQAKGQAPMLTDWQDDLYHTSPGKQQHALLTAIPYYTWDNRTPGAMQVWLPEVPEACEPHEKQR